jgi:hypothetical protein
MKPNHPSANKDYTPRTSTSTKFTYSSKRILLTSNQIPSDYPYKLEKVVSKYQILFIEFRATAPPPSDIGRTGDVWLDLTPGSYALYARTKPGALGWVKWKGAYKENAIKHPDLPNHALWVTLKNVGWYTSEGLAAEWSRRKEDRTRIGRYTGLDDELMKNAGEVIRILLLSEGGAAGKVRNTLSSKMSGGKRRRIAKDEGTDSACHSESGSDDEDYYTKPSTSRRRLHHTTSNAAYTTEPKSPASPPRTYVKREPVSLSPSPRPAEPPSYGTTRNINSFHQLLKMARGSDSCNATDLSNGTAAMIWTLTQGINYCKFYNQGCILALVSDVSFSIDRGQEEGCCC